MIYLQIKFVIKMQTRQNVEKMAKCGDFFNGARGNAKLMINFFWPYETEDDFPEYPAFVPLAVY